METQFLSHTEEGVTFWKALPSDPMSFSKVRKWIQHKLRRVEDLAFKERVRHDWPALPGAGLGPSQLGGGRRVSALQAAVTAWKTSTGPPWWSSTPWFYQPETQRRSLDHRLERKPENSKIRRTGTQQYLEQNVAIDFASDSHLQRIANAKRLKSINF